MKTTICPTRRARSILAFLLAVIAAYSEASPSLAQNKPKPADLPTIELSGVVEAVKPGYVQLTADDVKIRQPRSRNQSPGEAAAKPAQSEAEDKTTDKEQPSKFVVAVHPQDTKVTVSGTAEAKALKSGMFVRFSGKVDMEENVLGELVEVEVFTPAADFKPKFDVKLPPPKFASDEPPPESLSFEAEGPITAIKAGELTATFFNNQRVKVKLAKVARVKFTVADYSQARPGDAIRVKGKLAAPGQVLGETVSISLADRMAKKTESAPADDFAP